MASRRKAAIAAPTDAQLQEQASSEHAAQLEENLPPGATDFDPAQLERPTAQAIVESVAESIRIPEGHAARRRQEHAKLTVRAGDMLVHMLDKGQNEAGIGIRVEFPEGDKNRPTPEEKEIIRQHVKGEDGRSGFEWSPQLKMWHKNILRPGEFPGDVPSTRPVAIRLDAESRVQKLAESLKQHSVDPQGYAERIESERANAGQERIPD